MNTSTISQFLVGDAELARDKQRLLSLGLLAAAILMAWIPHERTTTFLSFWTYTVETGGFAPDLVTTIMGVALVLPLYLRGILKWRHASVYSILSIVINVTLIATFCKIILGGSFALGTLSYCLMAAIALTWLGMRPVAAMAWMAVLALSVVGLLLRNYAMGIYGYLFIICGFLGLLLHSEMRPGDILRTFKSDLSKEYSGRMTDSGPLTSEDVTSVPLRQSHHKATLAESEHAGQTHA